MVSTSMADLLPLLWAETEKNIADADRIEAWHMLPPDEWQVQERMPTIKCVFTS
jgi:hypothetical protein